MEAGVSKYDSSRQREILIGMTFSEIVLARVASQWTGQAFGKGAKEQNAIAEACVNYHTKHKQAPGKLLPRLLDRWMEKRKEATVKIMEDLLASILDGEEDQESINTDRLITIASDHFRTVETQEKIEKSQAHLQAGEIDQAAEVLAAPSKVKLGVAGRVDFFTDPEQVKASFTKKPFNPLVLYDDDLQLFYGHALERNAFIAFMAPQKGGKSFFLQDMAFRAMLNRKRVAYFQVGDMSEEQVRDRFYIRNSAHPMKNSGNRWPYTIKVPVSMTPPGEGKALPVVKWKEKTFQAPLDWKKAQAECERLMNDRAKSRKSLFGFHHSHAKEITALRIRNILEGWELDGFLADVVIVDYADNLAPMNQKMDKLEQEDHTWMMLRTISTERKCLLATATQCNRQGFSVPLLGRQHIGQNNQKLNHVTGIIGINMTPSEKEHDIRRLNWVAVREQGYTGTQVVHVAGCLAIGNPAMVSAKSWSD